MSMLLDTFSVTSALQQSPSSSTQCLKATRLITHQEIFMRSFTIPDRLFLLLQQGTVEKPWPFRPISYVSVRRSTHIFSTSRDEISHAMFFGQQHYKSVKSLSESQRNNNKKLLGFFVGTRKKGEEIV